MTIKTKKQEDLSFVPCIRNNMAPLTSAHPYECLPMILLSLLGAYVINRPD